MPLLKVEGLVKTYSGRRVVDGINFHVNRGEIVGLLGPNGAGKTTTFRMAMGMIPKEDGSVVFNGEDVSALPMFERARRGMGYLAQEPSIFRHMSVEDNVMAILETLPLSKREREERLADLLEELTLTRLSQNMADTLSGGERRRLEITRALVIEPLILFLDEPFSGVDPKACADIQKIIAVLRASGMSILLTDHNVWETLTITDRAYIIHEGKVLIHGTAEELIHDPEAQRLYLGDRFAAVQESFSRAKEKIESKSHTQHAGLLKRQTTRMTKSADSSTSTMDKKKSATKPLFSRLRKSKTEEVNGTEPEKQPEEKAAPGKEKKKD